jgi:putative sigma-54 modulation protein
MQISVTGRHMEITDAIREYTHDKLQHALAEFPRVDSVHVILEVSKYRHLAELVITAPNHIRVDARHESDDMYASIDLSIEKAEKQLHKLWDKMQDHKSREKLGQIERKAQAAERKQTPGMPAAPEG